MRFLFLIFMSDRKLSAVLREPFPKLCAPPPAQSRDSLSASKSQKVRRNRIEVIYPDKLIQKYHEKIIRNVIANRHKTNNLEKLTRDFIGINNLDGVVLGCTELPLVFPTSKFNNVVDCLDVLANELLFRYY